MGSVTKATPIPFIDSKSFVKKRRGHKTALSSYYACLSRYLLLMASGADTHTYTNVRRRNDFKKPDTHELHPRSPGLKLSTSQYTITYFAHAAIYKREGKPSSKSVWNHALWSSWFRNLTFNLVSNSTKIFVLGS